MSLSTMDTVLLVVGIADIAGIYIWMGICLRLAYTKMDLILEHLKNSPAIMARAPLRQGGPWGKLLLIGGISGILAFPGFHLKRGQLSPEDLANLPAALKLKLVRLHRCAIGLLLVLAALGAAVKFGLF
ncbi:hypothetical protein ACW9IB_09250 [Pseudomonas sp. SDO524_S393]